MAVKDGPPAGDGPNQLGLFDAAAPAANLRPEAEFVAALSALLPPGHAVILNDNRSTIFSVRPQSDGFRVVRLQRVFLAADDSVLKALARVITKPDARSRRVVDLFLASRRELFEACARDRPARAPKKNLTRGRHYDLKVLLRRVMKDYGLKIPNLNITWVRPGAPRRRHRRSIKFGSWCSQTRTVRVNAALDDPAVPEFFLEYIIYHELLHAVFPPATAPGGSRLIHNPEFQRFEKKFKRYPEARQYEKEYVRLRLK